MRKDGGKNKFVQSKWNVGIYYAKTEVQTEPGLKNQDQSTSVFAPQSPEKRLDRESIVNLAARTQPITG
jgi:hypothetical protein